MSKLVTLWTRLWAIPLFLFFLSPLSAQDFLFQGWYWDYPKTADGFNWAKTLESQAQELSDAGFTYVWLPPLSRASFGSGSNGYDPKDLFDLGEYGLGPTGFGSRQDVDDLIAVFQQKGINAVADVVYNHRDGGAPEDNISVAGWIRNFTDAKYNNGVGDNPYPSDRFRLRLPIGGNTGLGAGTYFIKVGSKSRNSNFYGKPYKIYTETNRKGFAGQAPDENENEPNGGTFCDGGNKPISLGRDYFANIDGSGCFVDEFVLTITNDDFYASGDQIYIYLNNREVGGLGDYSDHTVLELYYTGLGGNLEDRIIYQTYTDFTNLPSGQGAMNYTNFRPNGLPTSLSGDQEGMFFFYDYDQRVQSTRDVLYGWTRWLWNDVNIRGYRMDAVKQFDPGFVGDLLDNLHDNNIDPGLVVGEFFDSNTGALANWINNVYANMDEDTKQAIAPRLFDFSLRYALEAASDAFGYDARNVFNASMVDAQGVSGFNVVTFTDNHDFRDEGARIDNDPILGYAYILTNNQVGLPTVFYDDYYGKGLKPQIDELMDIHKQYIFGASQRDYLSRFSTPYTQNFTEGLASTTLLYQLSGGVGGRDVIVAINYAGLPLDVTHGVNITNMDLEIGDKLVDLTGNGSDTEVAADGTARFQLPPRSYSVWIINNDPTAKAGADATVACTGDAGTTVSLDGTSSSDPNGDELTYEWSGSFGTASGAQPDVVLSVGTHVITLTVDDGLGGTATDEVTITVKDDQAPDVAAVSGPVDPQPAGTNVSISTSFTDDCGAPYTVSIDWGDGSTSPGTVDGEQVSGTHTYTQAGVYEIAVSVSDNNGNSGTGIYQYVVIYDPSAGFVTGGGWIQSPAGAYVVDASLTGKANFGFVSKYQKGQSTPSGNTSFKFKAGDLDFKSTVYDWLVIAGAKAQFKGAGTINGTGNYGFMLTGRDGDLLGGGQADNFRIKIWDINNGDALVYDNQLGDADNAEATDGIEGGSIVIHNNNAKLLAPSISSKDPIATLQVFPNPSTGPLQTTLSLNEETRVQLEVRNASGQLVQKLFEGNLARGLHRFDWDGRPDQGVKQSSGAYFIRLMTDEDIMIQRVIITQ